MTAPPGQLDPITPPPPPARRGHGRVVVRYLAALLFTAAAAFTAIPDLVGVDHRGPFARAIAFRPWVLLFGLIVVVVLLVLVVAWRRARATLLPFAVGALVVLLAGGATIMPRVIADPLPTAGEPLSVLAFNTFEGNADPAELAALITAQRPDLVSISEAGERFAGELMPLIEPLGYRWAVSSKASADIDGVVALVSERLGEVRFDIGTDSASFPYLQVTGGGLGELTFVAYHAAAPTYFRFPRWRDDMALLAKWCAGGSPAIIAGDLNATLDHSLLRKGMTGCTDAAEQRGQGLLSTWSPTESTELFGPQIDHVLSTAGIDAESFSVHEIAGSDHRAILTTVRVP
ncbi:endonuclease/exonuclease/phosphatase family protein [Pseudonocardia lacus]|uniref:endonuclease/exonuclease/phosphatase family protein n=1 Tax=Pseudonocardia lacus TaxID=2835865 RepID=UPI001BDC7BA6|nr:endonuclease/exonuclease/phosphatase family protein [Pseudonocardia lacus]